MKRLVVTMAILTFAVTGCLDESKTYGPSVLKIKQAESGGRETYSINLSHIITKGNHSFIPLSLRIYEDSSLNYADVIFDILTEFEKEHPRLEIASWRLERSANHTNYFICLWVDHKPK